MYKNDFLESPELGDLLALFIVAEILSSGIDGNAMASTTRHIEMPAALLHGLEAGAKEIFKKCVKCDKRDGCDHRPKSGDEAYNIIIQAMLIRGLNFAAEPSIEAHSVNESELASILGGMGLDPDEDGEGGTILCH